MNWTPIKERLPKESANVLLTMRLKSTGECYVTTGVWSQLIDLETGEIIGPFTFACVVNENDRLVMNDYAKDNTIEIVAWAPFPEPYKDEFRVIVAGSRAFKNYALLKEKLDKAFAKHKPTSIVCGEAKGADELGRMYAEEHGIKVDSFPADWITYGKQAGYIRNEQMASNADACICFHMNDSAGTKHMINTAKKSGLQVRVIKV